MTEDTRRALRIIEPIAKELNLNIEADNDVLYINDIGIGISYNSTYATVMEFIGYLAIYYNDRFRDIDLTPEQREEGLKRYWLSDKQMERRKRNNDKTRST